MALKLKNYTPLLVCGLIGPVFFIVSFSVQGIFKEDYSVLRYPISSLAIGQNGWVQVVSFLITGLLIFLFAVGVYQKLNNRLIAVLLGLVALGLIASGIFTTDPVYGYPADEPFIYREFTLHGKLHTLFSLLVFINIPVTCFIMGKYFHSLKKMQWKYYSVSTGIAMLLLFLLTGVAFNQLWGLGAVAGLLQRLCVISGFVWIAILASYLNDKT